MESEEVFLETEEISIESDEDEDDVIGLNVFDIHDVRNLTVEESNLDPKLQISVRCTLILIAQIPL